MRTPRLRKAQFLQTFLQCVVDELLRLKDQRIRLERCLGTNLGSCSDGSHITLGDAAFVLLLVHMPVPVNFDFTPFRKEIHNRYADTV